MVTGDCGGVGEGVSGTTSIGGGGLRRGRYRGEVEGGEGEEGL